MNQTTKKQSYGVLRCAVCNAPIVDRRTGTKTCSNTCRKRLSRGKAKLRKLARLSISNMEEMLAYINSTECASLAQEQIANVLKHAQWAARRANVQVVR